MQRCIGAAMPFLLSACATAQYTVEATIYGEVDLARQRQISKDVHTHPWDHDYPVRVVQGKLPEGLLLLDGGQTLSIEAGFESRFEILGELTSTFADSPGDVGFANVYWYNDLHDSHSRGRDIYCKAQAPLRLLTLGIWSIFVPFNWPCFATYSAERDSNLVIHLQELRRAASRARPSAPR